MQIVGHINMILPAAEKSHALIDTIGEGAGVFSRLNELKLGATSVKFSEAAKDPSNDKKELADFTGQRTFANIRAYCYWAIRDALDPQCNGNLALPPMDELTQDLTEPRWSVRSDGKILIEEKSEIKKRLGRSPDFADALALTYFPVIKPFVWDSMAQVVWHPRTAMDWVSQRIEDDFRWHNENMELRRQGIIRAWSTYRPMK
jgi:hypothetical protein